jgi:ATP phosphoribosyltransferase regulatory subunit
MTENNLLPTMLESYKRFKEFCKAHDLKEEMFPTLLKAARFIETGGESLRKDLILTIDNNGDMLCLRPEFTIPVAINHIGNNNSTPKRYACFGEVFCQRYDKLVKFKAGIEDLGDHNIEQADANCVINAIKMTQHFYKNTSLQVSVGDQGILQGVMNALNLPKSWQKRLLRVSNNAILREKTLNDLSISQEPEDIHPLAQAGNQAELEKLIAKQLKSDGFSPHKGRSSKQIAARLIEKSQLSLIKLSTSQSDSLRSFYAIDNQTDLHDAVHILKQLAQNCSINIARELAIFEHRSTLIKAANLNSEIHYNPILKLDRDYYTGLMFHISSPYAASPLTKGGRYDQLLTLLGASTPIPAVGFALDTYETMTLFRNNQSEKYS